jgi:hypothetical protein
MGTAQAIHGNGAFEAVLWLCPYKSISRPVRMIADATARASR